MAGKSRYLQNIVLNQVLRGTAYSPPVSLYIGLFNAMPTISTDGVEVTGIDYVRQAISFETTTIGRTHNTNDIVFPDAGGSWGSALGFGIFDAVTGGNLLYFGPFNNPAAIAYGYRMEIPASYAVIEEG